MKKLMIAAAGMVAFMSTEVSAQSYSYTYTYAAASGTDNSGTFTILDTDSIYSLTAFNGTVGGTYYDLTTAGLVTTNLGTVYVGGLVNGVDRATIRTNDFFQQTAFKPGTVTFLDSFVYTKPDSGNFSFSPAIAFTRTIAASVPEPATWGMMVLGMGAIGFAMRRRQKIIARVSSAA